MDLVLIGVVSLFTAGLTLFSGFGLGTILMPVFALAFPARLLSLGGAVCGFFGGLSGNQGALRSAFPLKAGLSKCAFVATGVVAAVIVDAVRLLADRAGVLGEHVARSAGIVGAVAVARVCAFAGSYLGRRVLRKVTLRAVRLTVASAMLLIGVALALRLV